MTLKRPHLTPSQLEHLEEHIPYELLMLRFTLGRLVTEAHPLAWNAMLEAFAVHARNLYWFLRNDRKHQENYIASDFVDSYRAANAGDVTGPFQALNQQVLHLGTQRKKITADKFQADHAREVSSWIESGMATFREALSLDAQPHFKLDAIPPQGSSRFTELLPLDPQQTSSSFPTFWFTKIL